MPVWRCPHCATPQAESSRCWVCRRSTTSCGTCRHFRRGIAGGLGLCGLDHKRQLALDGTEMRACWTAKPAPVEVVPERRVLVAAGHGRIPGDATGRGYATGITARTAVATAMGTTLSTADGRRPRTFVPVDEPGLGLLSEPLDPPSGAVAISGTGAISTGTAPVGPSPVTGIPGTWWLWGDPEPWPEG